MGSEATILSAISLSSYIWQTQRTMKLALAIIAGIWMADGLSLLFAPRYIVAQLRELLSISPSILRWEGLGGFLGVFLIFGTSNLDYYFLWMVMGSLMIAKGLFFVWGPESLRLSVLEWCLQRDDVDYRFWGLGLCTLALLLLDALGWLPTPS